MVVQSGAASVVPNSRQINYNYRMLPTRTLYGVVYGSDEISSSLLATVLPLSPEGLLHFAARASSHHRGLGQRRDEIDDVDVVVVVVVGRRGGLPRSA